MVHLRRTPTARLLAFASIVALSAGCGLASEDALFGASSGGAVGAGGGATTSGAGGSATTSTTATTTSQGGGGTTSTTTSQGGGGTTSTTTTSQGGAPPNAAEPSCTDGTDDDGDGLADCADPGCIAAGSTCLDAPGGALGLFVPGGGACPPGTAPRALSSCAGAACSCGGTSAACSMQVTRWNFDDCASGQPSSLKTNDGCYYVNPGTHSAFIGSSFPVGATACEPKDAVVSPGSRAMCEVVSKTGCAGAPCLAPSVKAEDTCVLLPAGSACPAPYTGFEEAVSDQVGAQCTCACSKTGAPCTSTVTAYSDQGCAAATGASAPIDGACHSVGALGSYYLTAGTATATCDGSASLAGASGVLCCRKPPSP